MFVRHTPRGPTVLAHEGFIVVIHTVSTRAIVAFPSRWIVVIVAGIVGHAVLAVTVAGGIAMNGGGGTAVVTVVTVAGIAAAVAVIADGAGSGDGGVGQRHVAGCGHNYRARVQREEILLQPHAHCVARSRVVTQSQHVETLLSLPDV